MHYMNDLDPAIRTALMARQNKQRQQYPNLVPLPQPGGPVDQGLSGQSPRPANMQQALAAMRQQFPHLGAPQANKPNPQASKLQALMQAQMAAAQLYTRFQHKRRANGPYLAR